MVARKINSSTPMIPIATCFPTDLLIIIIDSFVSLHQKKEKNQKGTQIECIETTAMLSTHMLMHIVFCCIILRSLGVCMFLL